MLTRYDLKIYLSSRIVVLFDLVLCISDVRENMRLSSDLRAVYDRVFLAFLLHRPVDDSFLTRYELKTNFNIFFSHCYLTSYVSRIFSPLLSNLRAVYDRITVFFYRHVLVCFRDTFRDQCFLPRPVYIAFLTRYEVKYYYFDLALVCLFFPNF